MPTINPVKGTHDVIADEADAYAFIENLFYSIAESYGYRHIVTPVIEHTEVFDRAAGEGSDVVRKEMYTFLDKGERSITLRPEGTAGVMRSIVTNKLYATPDLPLKYYYCGTAYRYERPQLGRYREFRQLGVECVGENSVYLDAETIAFAYHFLEALGFESIKLKINTLGDKASREAYKNALRAYFADKIDGMCADCHERLRLNPLRILDCKVPEDHELTKGAPKIQDYLSPESKARYEKTVELLRSLDVAFEEDPTLVRGLDYYGEVVFEVHCISPEGKDYGAICGGGHYEGILSSFGGPGEIDVGVGFGMGIERIYSLMKEFGLTERLVSQTDVILMPLGDGAVDTAYFLADAIRGLGYSVEATYRSGKLGSFFKRAERKKAKLALIFGDDEIAKKTVQVKDLKAQQQEEVALAALPEYLRTKLGAAE